MNGPSFTQTGSTPSTWTALPQAVDALWDTCLRDNGGRDVARALTANFIGIADVRDAEFLQHTCELLQRRSPCRAFLALQDQDMRAHTASTSAATRSHGSLRDIVLERIDLTLPPRELQILPGLLRPLILDDLPSHLFWGLPWPTDDARTLDDLDELCRHTIVDSRRFADPARHLPLLAARRAAGNPITDLCWHRLRPWRRAFAEAFERFAWQPGTAVRGTLRHGAAQRSAAMLLEDWLRKRLSAQIELAPADREDDAGGPAHAALHVGDIEIVIELRNDTLVTHVTTPSHCYLPFAVAAPHTHDAQLLADAIDRA